jgi:hypothetical protein
MTKLFISILKSIIPMVVMSAILGIAVGFTTGKFAV